jgi:hypothetical protein
MPPNPAKAVYRGGMPPKNSATAEAVGTAHGYVSAVTLCSSTILRIPLMSGFCGRRRRRHRSALFAALLRRALRRHIPASAASTTVACRLTRGAPAAPAIIVTTVAACAGLIRQQRKTNYKTQHKRADLHKSSRHFRTPSIKDIDFTPLGKAPPPHVRLGRHARANSACQYKALKPRISCAGCASSIPRRHRCHSVNTLQKDI